MARKGARLTGRRDRLTRLYAEVYPVVPAQNINRVYDRHSLADLAAKAQSRDDLLVDPGLRGLAYCTAATGRAGSPFEVAPLSRLPAYSINGKPVRQDKNTSYNILFDGSEAAFQIKGMGIFGVEGGL